ncbi:MAG: hypothetical protein J3R72DRAFT_471507 [Linnemannia gamsii]|nr:MAG: hypothetical protein J3R72DRAFT_471507 [Linnemannia gamsii]
MGRGMSMNTTAEQEVYVALDAFKVDLKAMGVPITITECTLRSIQGQGYSQFCGHYLAEWRSATEIHLDRMYGQLSDAFRDFIEYTVDDIVGQVCTRVVGQFSHLQKTKIQEAIRDMFAGVSTPFTLSRRVVDAIGEERSKN